MLVRGARLDEANERGVIEHLGVDQPPVFQGEITVIGTHTPSPIGPSTKPCTPVMISCAMSTVDRRWSREAGGTGGTGGTMWSKVEEAVVLVEHHEEDGPAPDLGVRGQRREHPEVRGVDRRRCPAPGSPARA